MLRAGWLRHGEHTTALAVDIDEMAALAGIQRMRCTGAGAFALVTLMVECCRGGVAMCVVHRLCWGELLFADEALPKSYNDSAISQFTARPKRDTMPFSQTIKKEMPKKTLEIVVSATGFLLALGINSWVTNRHDEETFRSMLRSVQAEAASNEAVLNNSYGRYFDNGVVLKDFSVLVVSQSLTNPLFVKHLKPSELSLLNQYMRTLTLANSYRQRLEALTFGAANKDAEGWKENIMTVWRPTVNEAVAEIDGVEKMELEAKTRK
jgi:hypothetical protein